jgi:hypothetical protein
MGGVVMAVGRNALITTLISGVTNITDSDTYPNLESLTTAHVKYGTSRQENIHAMLMKNRKALIFGLGDTTQNDETIGGHQWIEQEVYAYLFVLGADTETDQKLAVTMGEELETYLYSTRYFSGDWYFTGRQQMYPDVWAMGKSQVVRTFLLTLMFKKLGTEGVP